MGTWGPGLFDNDAAQDWLDGADETRDVAQLEALIQSAFEANATFMDTAVNGVIMHTMSAAELEETIRVGSSHTKNAREKRSIEKMLRETFAEPYEDFGSTVAQEALTAAAFVSWCMGGRPAQPAIDELKNPMLRTYAPPPTIVESSLLTLKRLETHKERARGDRRWKAKIAALVADLERSFKPT